MAQCRDQGAQEWGGDDQDGQPGGHPWDGDDRGFLWYTTSRGTDIILTDVGDLSDALDLIDSLASICWEEHDLQAADGDYDD